MSKHLPLASVQNVFPSLQSVLLLPFLLSFNLRDGGDMEERGRGVMDEKEERESKRGYDSNSISILNSTQSMGNDEHGPTLHQ